MTAPLITEFKSLAQRYDAMLCDAWGVIHNGVTLSPGIEEVLTSFRQTRGPVVILTNAPRPSSVIPAQLDRLGLSRDAYDAIVTSGDATTATIETFLPLPAFRLGPEKDDALYRDLDIAFVPVEEAGFIVCTGLFDDQTETPDDYRDLLTRCRARDLPMICANPDLVVNWGGRMVYCAGALAEVYQELGGKVIYGGKPHQPIYDRAFSRLQDVGGAALDRNRVIAVGDSVRTDIGGANAFGVDALFVAGAGGIHDGPVNEQTIAKTFDDAGVHAVAVMETFTW